MVSYHALRNDEIRDACNVWAQKHPSVRMPAVPGGLKMERRRSSRCGYLCPWYGPLVDRHRHATGSKRADSHFDDAGACRKLGRITQVKKEDSTLKKGGRYPGQESRIMMTIPKLWRPQENESASHVPLLKWEKSMRVESPSPCFRSIAQPDQEKRRF